MASDVSPQPMLASLKEEVESCFRRINLKLKDLDEALKPAPEIFDVQEEVTEPPALVIYQRATTSPIDLVHQPTFRLASLGPEDPGHVRLHPRWLQLYTHCATYSQSMGELRSGESWRMSPLKNQPSTVESLFEHSASRFLSRPFSPEGNFRVAWDLCSLALLLMDAVILPLSIAWNWQLGFDNFSGGILSLSMWASVVFWSADIFINLNTAVYIQGHLVHSRRAILKRYAGTWLALDFSIVAVDYINLVEDEANLQFIGFLRFGRLFRALRMLRLLKMTKLDEIIQELAASTGRQWTMLVIAIFNSAIAAALAAHMATCVWFGVGSAVQEHERSWIEIADALDKSGGTQYIHSLRYVMNSPSPPPIEPDSVVERIVDIMNNIFTLAVIGSAVSKISGTLVELRAMNESRSRQRREVRVYLSNQDASFELVSRIMRFVEYKLEKVTPMTFDNTLISATLQTELYVSQRGEFLEGIPIFKLTKVLYSESFSVICGCMKKHVFETKERIFQAGAVSTQLYLTMAGKFLYVEVEKPLIEKVVLGGHWFEELALYAEGLIHRATLTAKTFCEVLTLESEDLVNALHNVPECASMYCEYAKAFVKGMKTWGPLTSHETELEQAELCCCKTKQYQEMFPDPKTRLKNIRLFPNDLSSMTQNELVPLEEGEVSGAMPHRSLKLPELMEMISDEEGLGFDDIEGMVIDALPELDRFSGTYAIFDQAGERDRATSSCMSLLFLVCNRYDLFTRPQVNDENRLTHEQWLQLQGVLSKPTFDQIQAALVFNAIRGLGKSVTIQSQIPDCEGRPVQTVRDLIDNAKNVVPSVISLSSKGLHYLHCLLSFHESFNVAQMLQGENIPASIAQLEEKIQEFGQEVFHCYVLFLLGFMSGLSGGRGSKFLTSRMATGLIACTQVFSSLNLQSPTAVFWAFLRRRAAAFGAAFKTAEDLALARLACLSRVHTPQGFAEVQMAWLRLSFQQQAALVEHLLADGIAHQAVIFTFLPDCIQKAKANATVGLKLLLEVLVDLLAHLKTQKDGGVVFSLITWIDLSDLSEFTGAVQNSFIFKTCISRAKLDMAGVENRPQVRLQMTSGNWSRINEMDSDVMNISHQVTNVVERLKWIERTTLGDSWAL